MHPYSCCRWICLSTVIAVCSVAVANASDSHQFQYRAPLVGERVIQWVNINSNLKSTIRHKNQIVSSEDRRLQSEQLREITILETSNANSSKVRLTYSKAQSVDTSDPRKPQFQLQAVANKSYLVSRQGEELVVTDLDGKTPPADELRIVKSNMQSVGKSNPLTVFLRDRTVCVGETLEMPKELAAELLSGADGAGGVQRVALQLREVRTVEGVQCAEFQVMIEGGQGVQDAQSGTLVVETATCRSRRFDLDSTLATAEQRGPSGNTFTVSNRGKVRVAVKAAYRDASVANSTKVR